LRQRDELLELARGFDLAALGEIYDCYSPGLVRYATRLLGQSDLAEECVAETFSRFLKALHTGGGPTDALQAYLYRMAHHWITDHYRRQPPPTFSLNETLASDLGDPAQTALENIEREQVRDALMRLTPEQREVVVLRYLEGWENAEVAALLGKPVGAIKALQHRALDALRRQVLPGTEKSDD
jgi:RNA polymerase sigma-70 factor (ECF subfamily)